MNLSFEKCSSPIGHIFVVDRDGKLAGVIYEHQWERYRQDCTLRGDTLHEVETPLVREAKRQLSEYFAGVRKEFALPYEFSGSAFQMRVWKALVAVPYGQTRSYKEQAISIDHPKAVRAIGYTNSRNLINIVVPCHRIIGSNGSLTGYGGGLEAKRFLLDFERGVLASKGDTQPEREAYPPIRMLAAATCSAVPIPFLRKGHHFLKRTRCRSQSRRSSPVVAALTSGAGWPDTVARAMQRRFPAPLPGSMKRLGAQTFYTTPTAANIRNLNAFVSQLVVRRVVAGVPLYLFGDRVGIATTDIAVPSRTVSTRELPTGNQ